MHDKQQQISDFIELFKKWLKSQRSRLHSAAVADNCIVFYAPFQVAGKRLDWKRGTEVYRLPIVNGLPERFMYELAALATTYLSEMDDGLDDVEGNSGCFVGEDFDREFSEIGQYFRSAFFRSGSHVQKGSPFRG